MNEIIVNKILLSTYGCNLDHSRIYHLVKAHLFPFEVQFDEIPIYAPSKTKTLLLTYDVYDANFELNEKSGDYPFRYFLINEERLIAFEQALVKLNSGTLTRCFDARGHIWVTINGLEYATRTLISFDDVKLVFMDKDVEGEGNALIRNKLHFLPKELHYLIIHNRTNKSYEEQQMEVKEWILKIQQGLAI